MSCSGKIISELIECVDFAAVKHQDGRRNNKAQSPYINHPIGVAHILTEEARVTDLNVVKAAILHDTVEVTDTTYEDLVQEFGQVVADIVIQVSDDMSLPDRERKALQVQNAPKLTFDARLVRLADKLYNLREVSTELRVGWSEEKRRAYFEWAKQVVDQIRGTNVVIEEELDKLFHRFCPSSQKYNLYEPI